MRGHRNHLNRGWTRFARTRKPSEQEWTRSVREQIVFPPTAEGCREGQQNQEFATPQTTYSPSAWPACRERVQQTVLERTVVPQVPPVTKLRQVPPNWHSGTPLPARVFAVATVHEPPSPGTDRPLLSLVSTSPVHSKGILLTCAGSWSILRSGRRSIWTW